MSDTPIAAGWRAALPAAVRPYAEPAPLAAFFLGISSGFPFAMIGATLTTRLAQDGIDKKAVTAFSLAILAYNLKWLWAWAVDGIALPGARRFGRRVTWLWLAGALTMAAVIHLGLVDPRADLARTAWAAVLVGIAGATYDIVIDAYRIELLSPEQLGPGAGMSQYGWRIGSVLAGSIALLVAGSGGWGLGYGVCAALALSAMLTGAVMGEPQRHHAPSRKKGLAELWVSIAAPLADFFRREGALLVLAFILVHKIGDTLSQLAVRLLFNDLGYSNGEIALWDVGLGFWAYLIGIFIGGLLYARVGLTRSVLISLWLMAISNLGFAVLAAVGHSNAGMAAAMAFENGASGIGGVTVVAYFSALCDLRFTAAQYALISAAASLVGRLITGTSSGALIEALGYVGFYLLTTVIALPGIALFWYMVRTGLVERSIGSAGTEPPPPQPGG
ncbi:MFS transporter [Sphingomonas morindae]|uniref:MFS transporter n=1 Tax=Sphingomonas morindae TaxID=1541170 RepID=A0ABY4X5R5_9SPHN|nr:MFS transporter [Sphingomonas morindae]USI72180.1 MFS transporter [Sphingomonas morindae]